MRAPKIALTLQELKASREFINSREAFNPERLATKTGSEHVHCRCLLANGFCGGGGFFLPN